MGQIVSMELTEVAGPLGRVQRFGDPYLIKFKVSETIRGDKLQKIEIVLSLQSTHYLEYLHTNKIEVLLLGGPGYTNDFPRFKIGIEEQGRRVSDRYHFLLLDPLDLKPDEEGRSAEDNINKSYDNCRMFSANLELIQGRSAILKRARTFAKSHTELLEAVWLLVPNEFGAMCADPNAYCLIKLPVCKETERILVALLQDPGIVLRRIPAKNESRYQNAMVVWTLRALVPFPSNKNTAIVNKLVEGYDPKLDDGRGSDNTPEAVQRQAWRLLERWKNLGDGGVM